MEILEKIVACIILVGVLIFAWYHFFRAIMPQGPKKTKIELWNDDRTVRKEVDSIERKWKGE
jgi:hypothetical protein